MRGGAKSSYPNKSASASAPRGVKNNNPGNIRISANAWRGKLANNTDGSFEQFETMDLGARAHLKNLQAYFKCGLNTVELILNTWAPPSENHTKAYVEYVAKQIGVSPDAELKPTKELLVNIGFAMSKMENGLTKHITKLNYVNGFNSI